MAKDYDFQLIYGGKGYLDGKIQPVDNLAALDKVPFNERFVGLTITVLDDGSGKPHDYWLKADRFTWERKYDDDMLRYQLDKVETTEGYYETYALQKYKDEAVVEVCGKINIPQDFLVKDGFAHRFSSAVSKGEVFDATGSTGTVYHITATDDYVEDDIALIFVVNTKDGTSEETFIQFKATSLIDTYVGDGKTIELIHSGSSKTFKAVTDVEEGVASFSAHTELKDRVDIIEPIYLSAVTVNDVEASVTEHSAKVEIDSTDIKLGEKIEVDIEGEDIVVAESGATVYEALSGMVSEIAKNEKVVSKSLNDLNARLLEADASMVSSITSPDETIKVERDGKDVLIDILLQESDIKDGVIQILKNELNELYGVMYYDNETAEE